MVNFPTCIPSSGDGIQEFNLGVGSHVSITLLCELCSCCFFFSGGGGGRGCCKTPRLFCFVSFLNLLI